MPPAGQANAGIATVGTAVGGVVVLVIPGHWQRIGMGWALGAGDVDEKV